MIRSEIPIGLLNYEISEIRIEEGEVRITARYSGPLSCAHCGGSRLRSKGVYLRRVRHENLRLRRAVLELEGRKFQCRDCNRQFRQRFPGILRCQRSSEAFQEMIFRDHLGGINRSRLVGAQRSVPGSVFSAVGGQP